MRYLIVSGLFFLTSGFANAADQDTMATRQEAAERYLEVADIRKMLLDTVEAMSGTLPADKAASFKDLMTRHLDIDAVETGMLQVMTKHFTTRELDALARFYGSPEGKSSMAKFGVYMADAMPMIQREIQRAAQAAQVEQAKTP
jgi:hypothetical protein